jgi:SAM-dependent methyltransferase
MFKEGNDMADSVINNESDMRIQEIGNVKLNLRGYDGEDKYSDGDVEDSILNIVKNHDPSEFPKIISESGSWPILYHLSSYRENILAGIQIGKNDSVLEIGGGCGAITGILCREAGKVTTIELSKRRSEINAYRHKDEKNLEIIVANFQTAYKNLHEKFDYIMLIGVLEYAKLYIDDPKPYQGFLKQIGTLLKPNGKIVIAIENRFGLKYFAGCKEDHLGTIFEGVNGYSDGKAMVQTFTRKGLEDIIVNAGFKSYKFYYPYPDYKFATNIYSDEYLPKKGELDNNIRNFDAERLRLFDEKKVFDELIDNGLFPYFSNSFLVVVDGDK